MTKYMLSIKDFCTQFPTFKYGQVRNLIYYENRNGLNDMQVILRIGKRIYIDVDRWFAWIEKINHITKENQYE